MLFNSLHYFVFFPLVVMLYYLIPSRFRWMFLLAASYYFYMSWEIRYVLLILLTTTVDYTVARLMVLQTKRRNRLLLLWTSLTVNLGLLFFFKYFNFISDSIQLIFNQFNIFYNKPEFQVLLPVGISFYTFQTLSYTLEVYQGKQKPEKHFGYFALYIVYFPQLVAGPIERFSRLAPQLKTHHYFSWDHVKNGLRLILFGLFIKMVIADNLAPLVNQVYENPQSYHSLSVMMAMFFYSFQIYSDFFGYSIIAVGSSLVMGIKIMDNFKTPYLAKNIAEFWNRWHISLSTWFKDYLFIPLGGSRVKIPRFFINILLVFGVSGLWHGANWTFVIWGLLHGLYYLGEFLIKRVNPVKSINKGFIYNGLSIAVNFILVSFAWIFFRSESFDKAITMIQSLANNSGIDDTFRVNPVVWVLLLLFILSDILLYNTRFDEWIGRKSLYLRWSVYAILLFSVLALAGVNNNPFIYFQF